MPTINEIYWENRYKKGETGWDMHEASPALIAYAAQLMDKSIKILIPGCGNAHEAEALLGLGFTDITLLDIAESPLKQAAQRFSKAVDAGHLHLVHADFFAHEGQYDLILEQTFFCAIHPGLRPDYAEHMWTILKPGGTLAGLLFEFPLTEDGPPFGGNKDEYSHYFGKYFNVKLIEKAFNSIKPREGKELFFILKKPSA